MSKGKPAFVDICGKNDGNLWSSKPIASSGDGLFAHVVHRYTTTSTTLQGRIIRFNRVSFSNAGDKLAAVDQQGSVYLVALRHNRFSLLRKLGSPCTALAFANASTPELYVALADGVVQCVNWKNGEVVATLKGHSSSVKYISLHSDGRYLMTTSSAEAILWDAKSHQRLRTLNGAQGVGVQQGLFVPTSNTLVTCFKDDSIFAWTLDTLQFQYRLVVPDGPAPKFRALTVSADGRTLVAGGRSCFLHVWALDTRRLVRVIQLPNTVRRVDQVFFITDNCDGGVSQTLGVVCQDGILRFLRIDTCRLLFELGTSNGKAVAQVPCRPVAEPITHAAASRDGHYIASVADSGALQLFSVETVCPQLSQPPAPLVHAMTADKSKSALRGQAASSRKNAATASASSKPPMANRSLSDSDDDADPNSFGDDSSILVPSPSAAGLPTAPVVESTEDTETSLFSGMQVDVAKLYSVLRGYGRYPEKYRLFIWRSILKLPENHAAYASLCNRGTHVAYQDLHEKYPVKSRKLLRQLQRTLSALAHWSPIFGEVTFLPQLIFPFVKLFSNNRLLAFEICATLLLSFTQHWFDFHPHVPVGILGMVETVLAQHDIGLMRHLTKHNITSAGYAWPLMETMMSEVLTRDEWLQTMDNVLSNPPHYLLFVVIAYLTCNRQALLRCRTQQDFEFFFKHRNAIDITHVIKEAYRLSEATPHDIHPQSELRPVEALTRGQYPVFSDYPKYVVDYQRNERDRIRQEELDLLRERQATIAAHQAKVQRHRDEETFQRHQQMLAEAEQERQAQLEEEDRKLHEQRLRLLALKREVQANDMVAMDATRRRLMDQQIALREAELKRLDDELERKARLRHEETELAVEAARVQAAEIDMQKSMLEAEVAGQQHADRTAMKHAWTQHEHETALRLGGSVAERSLLDANSKQQRQVFEAHQRLAKLQQHTATQKMKDELGYRARLDTLEQDLECLKVTRQELANQAQAGELATSLHKAEMLERQHHQQQQGAAQTSQRHNAKQPQKTDPLVPVDLTESPPHAELSVSSLPPSDVSDHDAWPQRVQRTPQRYQDEDQLLREVTNLRRRVAKSLQDGSRSLGTSDSNA